MAVNGLVARLREKMGEKAALDTSQYMLPTDPERLVVWLEDHRTAGKRRQPDLQMKLALAYTLGHQWVRWDRDRRQFQRPVSRPNDPNAPIRVTVNKIGGIVERTIARLLKEAPEPECRPTSDDEHDVMAASVATRILEHEMDREHWQVKLIDLYFWVTVLGWSFMHPHWDADAGPMLGAVEIEVGDEKSPPIQVHEGEIHVEVVPAFELSVDPNARKMDNAKWCVRTVSLTKEACWEKFGVVPANDSPGRTLLDEVYALTDRSYEHREFVSTVPIHQMWIRPGTRMCPDGAVITWSGQIVLEQKPFPYDHGKLPFVQFDLLPGLGTRAGRTWVNDLIPMQADYNDARSREAMIRKQMVPKLMYSVGSIDAQRLTTRVEAIPYTPTGNPPTYLMPDGRWQAQHETVMNRAQGELAERAGQADVSSGNAPASMPAASVMALQEADDTKMAITAKLLATGISNVGWQWLMLVKQFWDQPRIIRTWSQEGDIEAAQFSSADLAEQLDVHVDAESSLPRSKTARLQLLSQLASMGMFGSDPRMFLKQLDMPGIAPLLASMSIDHKQAERENAEMFDGETSEVHNWDNHQIHMQEHNDFRKTEIFDKIYDNAKLGDKQAVKVVAAFEAHVQVHQEELIKLQQGQQNGVPDKMIETLTYKDAPGDIQAQMEAQAGLTPSPTHGPPPGPQQQGMGPVGPMHGGAPAAMGGQANALTESAIHSASGVGGPNEPGAVPGISADHQAQRLGR